MLDILPDEIIVEIFGYITLVELVRIELVCQKFKHISREIHWPHLIKLRHNENIAHVARTYCFSEYDLSYSDVTDDTLELLAPLCRRIDLSECDEISDVGVKYLTNCQEINISYCPQISDEVIENLRNSGCNIIIEEKNRHGVRYYKVVDNITGIGQGRITGETPKQAASKAFTSFLKKRKENNEKIPVDHIIQIRESTRGSKRESYFYKCNRVKLSTPQELRIIDKDTGEMETITYFYRNSLFRVHQNL